MSNAPCKLTQTDYRSQNGDLVFLPVPQQLLGSTVQPTIRVNYSQRDQARNEGYSTRKEPASQAQERCGLHGWDVHNPHVTELLTLGTFAITRECPV